MKPINLLRRTLKQHLLWHGARLNFFALFSINLFVYDRLSFTLEEASYINFYHNNAIAEIINSANCCSFIAYSKK